MSQGSDSIYDELDVPRVINASGTKTRIGGSLIRPEAVDAMSRAADGFARISDLQAKASEVIADATGAEAGYVASGGAAALMLGTAACLARVDLARMAALPETPDGRNEVVMARTHRTGYDHAIRTAGAAIVDIGTNDRHLGTGAANVEPWEIEAAITEDTVAIAYVQKPYTEPPLETVCEIAHAHDVPVIVDAAAELPPTTNLGRFVDAGADIVAFSGGKAIRGPQSTGFIAGRADLIRSAALQHLDMHAAADAYHPPDELVGQLTDVPRQGIGRPLKVGKEELVGFIRALELFLEEDQDALQRGWHARIDDVVEALSGHPALSVTVSGGGKTAVAPEAIVTVETPDPSAATLVSTLRRERPRIYVGADDLDLDRFTINPMCLTDDEASYVCDRILDAL